MGKAEDKLADDLLRAGEKRGADEILGIDTENMSPSKVRKLLKEKGIKGLAEGGSVKKMNNGGAVMKGRGNKFKGVF